MHSDIRIVSGCMELRRFCTHGRVAECTSVMVRERRYRGIKIKYLGHPSEDLRAIVLGNLFTLSERDAERLASFGVTVSVVSWIHNLDNTLEHKCPRGWAAGKTWNDADGIYMSGSKIAAVAELTNAGKSKRGAAVLWHELGHAIDHSLGWYSHTSAFEGAYNDDVSNLNNQQKEQHTYFLQPELAGKEEVFAEIYAALNTPRPGEIHTILQLFPQSMLQLLYRLQQPENS